MTGVSLEIYRAAIGYFNCYSILVSRTRLGVSFRTLYVVFMPVSLHIVSTPIVRRYSLYPGPRQQARFSMAHMNVRSLNSADKLNEISALAFDYTFDILAISETWLNENVSNELIRIPGYHAPLRKDRAFGRGGGVGFVRC